ncbi:hypothetical protein [Mangrovicoccus ximenensis]|uniref:hypothetical protein n=1 Tax=Mangrovicoccus ximenensis TaxID=1911570 RepID=UPI000D3B71E7|nr:hypothetical protein [Mangrovicoccus ximenensis]
MTAAASTNTKRALPLPPARMLSRVEAAAYVGVSPSFFDSLIAEGTMPQSLQLRRRRLWDVRQLDAAIDHLRPEESAEDDLNEWD